MKNKDKERVWEFFFSNEENTGSVSIVKSRNILAHNTSCCQRTDQTYDAMIHSWEKLLSEEFLNSNEHYQNCLGIAKIHLLGPLPAEAEDSD